MSKYFIIQRQIEVTQESRVKAKSQNEAASKLTDPTVKWKNIDFTLIDQSDVWEDPDQLDIVSSKQ